MGSSLTCRGVTDVLRVRGKWDSEGRRAPQEVSPEVSGAGQDWRGPRGPGANGRQPTQEATFHPGRKEGAPRAFSTG